MRDQIKLCHIITGLSMGGAEMMLYKLLSRLDNTYKTEVISLTDIGPVGEKIMELGIPVRALGMKRGIPSFSALLNLTRMLRESSPNIIQTWMYHSDLIGGLAGKMAGNIPVTWGIHHSNLSAAVNKKTTIWTAKICAKLSGVLPEKIVCCSEASRRVHVQLGYKADKIQVIPNGFDMDVFYPNQRARLSLGEELGLSSDAQVIGLVSRFDPQKDHFNFVQAAAHLSVLNNNVQFLLCGDGVVWENEELAKWIDEAGIRDKFHLLGRRGDVQRIFAALDIATLSSRGEGFPNVLGEAMACGVPCVATDVGDSAVIVGDTGYIVPPRDSYALAKAWNELLSIDKDERCKLGMAARKRIADNFSLEKVVSMYEDIYKGILNK